MLVILGGGRWPLCLQTRTLEGASQCLRNVAGLEPHGSAASSSSLSPWPRCRGEAALSLRQKHHTNATHFSLRKEIVSSGHLNISSVECFRRCLWHPVFSLPCFASLALCSFK